MVRTRAIRLLLAVVAACGVVATLAVLALAAPGISHHSAGSAVYCPPPVKANLKAAVDAANVGVAQAQAAVAARRAAVAKAKAALKSLQVKNAKARQAYFKAHKSAVLRARFVAKQKKAVAAAKKKIAAAQAAFAAAGPVLAAAQQKQAAAQAAFAQCT